MITEVEINDPKYGLKKFKYHEIFDKYKNMSPWLHIPKQEWGHILETIEPDVIKDSLTVLFTDYPFPYRQVTIEEAIEDFKILKNLDVSSFPRNEKWFSKANINLNPKIKDVLLFSPTTGNKSSDFFFQEERMRTGGLKYGAYATWVTPTFMRTMTNGILTLKHKEINSTSVRSTIALRRGMASQFKPSTAKYIYETYGGNNILDFSSGWGDRLSGFLASKKGISYVGIDPNPLLHEKYKLLYDTYKPFFENKEIEMICEPAEDVDYTRFHNKMDLVFTSPPYFNRERYTYDESQSWIRYSIFETWLEEFFFKTLEKISRTIKTGGYLIINISDIYAKSANRKKKEYLEICNPMLKRVEQMGGLELIEIIGYKLAKRPNLLSAGTAVVNNKMIAGKFNQDVTFGEPVFVWRKL